MRAGLDDTAVVDNHDAVGLHRPRQPVRDQHRGTRLEQHVERALSIDDPALVPSVHPSPPLNRRPAKQVGSSLGIDKRLAESPVSPSNVDQPAQV